MPYINWTGHSDYKAMKPYIDIAEKTKADAISNFSAVLPAPQSDLAQEITKDPYNFNFLTLDKKYDEKDLKEK